MIEAKGLTKRYGDFTALNKVSFQVRQGEVLGFLGPNGAGKTTTMKILTCFIAPTEGTAEVHGCNVHSDPMGVRQAIGYLPESNPLYTEMLVLEYLQWVARMRGLEGAQSTQRIRTVVEQAALGDVVTKEIRALSKGYRQRVGLASALVHEPPILILDEPMSGLDPNQAVEIRELIKSIGRERTVIFSTHNLAEAELACDRFLIITGGKIVADDTPLGLRRSAGNRRFVVGFRGGDRAGIESGLRQLPGVGSVRLLEEGAETRFELEPDGALDLREMVFEAAGSSSWPLVELRGETRNLERRFRELTVSETTDPSFGDREDA